MPGFPQQQAAQHPGMLPGQAPMPGQPPMPGMVPPGQQPPMGGMPGRPPPMPGSMSQPGMAPPMPGGMPQQPRPPMPTGMAPGMAPAAPAASKIDPSQIPRPLPYAIPTQVGGRQLLDGTRVLRGRVNWRGLVSAGCQRQAPPDH